MNPATDKQTTYPSDNSQIVWAAALWLLLVVLVVLAIGGAAAWLVSIVNQISPEGYGTHRLEATAPTLFFAEAVNFFLSILWMPAFMPLIMPLVFLLVAAAIVHTPQTRKIMRPNREGDGFS